MRTRRQFLLGCAGAVAVLPPTRSASSFELPNLPRPRFHIGQEAIAPWKSEEGMRYGRVAIIGAIYNPTGYEPEGWWYLPLWVDNPDCPWMVGKDDGHYWHEQWLKAA